MSASAPDIKQDIETLIDGISTLSPLFAQEVDIHMHTHQIGSYYQHFNAIDQRYNLSRSTQTLEVVIGEILAKCPQNKKKNITTVLDTIRRTTRADNETNANLQELLIRTWSLVNMPNNHRNAFDIFIENLDHNIATGGGCVPGIAARLIQPYTHFVLRMLEQIPVNQNASTKATSVATRQAQESALIQQAIAESLKTPQTQTRPVAISPAVPTNTKQTKPLMPIVETKVHQEMIDPLTGQAMSPEQIRAQTAAFDRFQLTEEERATRMAVRAAKEAKAEADFQRVLKESEAERIREARLQRFGNNVKK